MNWDITIGNLLTIAGFLGVGIGSYYAQVRRVDGLAADLRAANERAAAANVRAEAAAAEVVSLRLEAARTYATMSSLETVESRIVSAINKLGDRIDRALDDRRHV